jgi:hypothetical protein
MISYAIVARMGIEITLPTALTRPAILVERILHWQEGHSFSSLDLNGHK